MIRGTRMAHEYEENPEGFHLFTKVDEYIDLVINYVEHLRPDLVLERFVSQSPKELLIAPDWGLKNYEFVTRLQKRMKERGAYQGKKYRDSEKELFLRKITSPQNKSLSSEIIAGEQKLIKVEEWNRKQELKEMSTMWE